MSLAFKIMALAIFINIAAGILVSYAGFSDATGIATDADRTQGDITNLADSLGGDVSGPPAESSTNFFERLLDTISLGLFTNVKTFVNNYVLGLPTLLKNAGIIDATLSGIIKGLFIFVYAIGMFQLFTNRQVLHK